MPIINLKDLKTYVFPAHGGKGNIKMKFSFEEMKGIGMWSFFAYAELPVGSDTGFHRHEGNDEWYLILDGEATIVIDSEKQKISKDDSILTLSGSSHAIIDVVKKLKFIAVEVNRDEKPKPFVHQNQ